VPAVQVKPVLLVDNHYACRLQLLSQIFRCPQA